MDDLFELDTDVAKVTSWLETPSIGQETPAPFARREVSDRRTRYLMTKANGLSRNAELLLHEDAGKANPLLWELAKRLRMVFVPHTIFACCSILRGHLGVRMPISAVGEKNMN
jgi:hypothetical protein